MFGQRRKLEAELESTYERLREAETLRSGPCRTRPRGGRRPATPAAASAVAADEVTVVAPREAATMVESGEDATVVEGGRRPSPREGRRGCDGRRRRGCHGCDRRRADAGKADG